ncbi:hypothetical protein [Rhodococcus sp. SORGH_AS_0303]|uniref:hypothetical protein n=1 Tax=Rhodococcus sp. SORGH_AS_0303 TaxID=3041753 RepID=UPI0027D92B2B|nr:hypothetical protein [Rhodococcus sp. SORGH_AS_0303]
MTDYYPHIKSISDDRGHSISNFNYSMPVDALRTGDEVRPGDVVKFTCVGEDPKNRELEWTLQSKGGLVMQTATGNEATMTWTVEDGQVQDNQLMVISMRALGTKYHRHGTTDHGVHLRYRVIPPNDAD